MASLSSPGSVSTASVPAAAIEQEICFGFLLVPTLAHHFCNQQDNLGAIMSWRAVRTVRPASARLEVQGNHSARREKSSWWPERGKGSGSKLWTTNSNSLGSFSHLAMSGFISGYQFPFLNKLCWAVFTGTCVKTESDPAPLLWASRAPLLYLWLRRGFVPSSVIPTWLEALGRGKFVCSILKWMFPSCQKRAFLDNTVFACSTFWIWKSAKHMNSLSQVKF